MAKARSRELITCRASARPARDHRLVPDSDRTSDAPRAAAAPCRAGGWPRAARVRGRRHALGELAGRTFVSRALGDADRDRDRRLARGPQPARDRERRPDGRLLLPRRARDQARGAGRRAGEHAAGGAAGGGGARRDARAGAALSRAQPERADDARVGHPDGDGHRVRARRARAARRPLPAGAPDLPVGARDRRRSRRGAGDRAVLHRVGLVERARRGGRSPGVVARGERDRSARGVGVRADRSRALGRGAAVGRARDRRRRPPGDDDPLAHGDQRARLAGAARTPRCATSTSRPIPRP